MVASTPVLLHKGQVTHFITSVFLLLEPNIALWTLLEDALRTELSKPIEPPQPISTLLEETNSRYACQTSIASCLWG